MDNGEICSRNRHLFAPGKKRVLALDGGVRGVMSKAYLERLEKVLADIEGRPVRLCGGFDLIGGTSTGAIIATGLAAGFTASGMDLFYRRLAPKVFGSSRFHAPGFQAHFDAKALQSELDDILRGFTLDSEKLNTGLCMILKRLDTGSCWVAMNNPRSAFWETPPDNSFVGNRYLSLPDLVRASAAAPYYFDLQTIEIVKGVEPGLFLDGGLTLHNNPSLALLFVGVLPSYGLNWKMGVDDLSILSIGTGSFRTTLTTHEAQRAPAVILALEALAAQISDNQELTLILLSCLGEATLQWPINSELGDLGRIAPPFGNLFRYLRCGIMLERAWLAQNLDDNVTDIDVNNLRQIENPANVASQYEYGRLAAETQITHEMFRDW